MSIQLDRLKSQLLTSGLSRKDQPLFQVINQLITTINDIETELNGIITGVSGSVGSIENLDFLTHTDESATLPNSRNLIAGTNIAFNDTVANQRTISATSSGDVAGPASAVDGQAAVFNGTTGKIIKVFNPTAGSVLFAGVGGILEQDNANFFWDNTNNWLGIGTAPTNTFMVRGNPVSEILASFQTISNGSAYVRVIVQGNSNAAAGFDLINNATGIAWKVVNVGNGPGGSALGFRSSGSQQVWVTQNSNFLLGASTQPTTGTMTLVFGDGTIPATMASNTAGIYANDVGGTVNIFGINEAGESTRLTYPAPQTYTEVTAGALRTFDSTTVTLPQLADVVGTMIADLRARGQFL